MDFDTTQTLLSVIAALVGALVTIVTYAIRRMLTLIDELREILRQAEREIHVRINGHETRITRIETKSNWAHQRAAECEAEP